MSLKEEAWHFPGVGSPTLPVHSEVLKPKDVQEADGPARVLHFLGGRLIDGGIDLVHNPHEEPPVDTLKDTHQPWCKADPSGRQSPFLNPLDPDSSLTHPISAHKSSLGRPCYLPHIHSYLSNSFAPLKLPGP